MKWSKNWKSSKSPRKQRNYVSSSPLHLKSKLVRSHLSKELREKYKTRSARVRKGDKVKILRGMYKGKIGEVEKVNIRKQKIFVQGAETIKKDGSKNFHPIHPSNIIIQDLKIGDKKRLTKLKGEK